MVAGDQLGDEAQVGDLRGGPAELEGDNEGPVVEEGGPLWGGRPTAQARAEDEGEGQQDTDGAWGQAEGMSLSGPSHTSLGLPRCDEGDVEAPVLWRAPVTEGAEAETGPL